MGVTRQDAWTKDEDRILADTVIHYIREGKTQLEAFKEVAKQLSRTFSACGFRWNATIRKAYQNDIQKAKETQKRDNSRTKSYGVEKSEHDKDTIETAISLLERMKNKYSNECQLTHREQETMIAHLKQENSYLQEKIQRYETAWEEMSRIWDWAITDQLNNDN